MALWGIASVYYFVLSKSRWAMGSGSPPTAGSGRAVQVAPEAGRVGREAGLIDALVGGLGVAGAGATLAFAVVLSHSHGTGLGTAVDLAIPVGDLGLLAFVVAALTVAGWRQCGVWRWIAPAFGIFVVIDSVYVVQAVQGSWQPGGILDVGWPLAALLVGFAAWRPEANVRGQAQTGTAVLAAGGLAALVLLVADHFVRANLLALGLATLTICAVLLRLSLTCATTRGC